MNQQDINDFLISLGSVKTVLASKENGDPEMAWGDAFYYITNTAGQSPNRCRRLSAVAARATTIGNRPYVPALRYSAVIWNRNRCIYWLRRSVLRVASNCHGR